MAEEKVPQKVTMIVNGQPIDMCLKTIILSNARAQKVLRSLKQQSLNDVKTLRLFWGDVVMLNIITNQMLQTVDSRDLARALKPVNSVKEDILEYRVARDKKKKRLRDALVVALDENLPLDYSSELEKYYKDEYIDKDKKSENEFNNIVKEINSTTQIDTNTKEESTLLNDDFASEKTSKSKNIKKEKNNSTKNKTESKSIIDNKVTKKQNNPETETTQKRATYKNDNDEEYIDFLSLFGSQTKDEDEKETVAIASKPIEDFISINASKTSEKHEQFDKKDNITEQSSQTKTEFSAMQEAFTNYNSLDLDKLFD